MAIFKDRDRDIEGLLSALLALRLHQIASQFQDFESFRLASGMSRGALIEMMKGTGNPTFATIERLARRLGLSVWAMLARDDRDEVVRQDITKLGLPYDEIAKHVAARRAASESMNALMNPSHGLMGAPAAGEDDQ